MSAVEEILRLIANGVIVGVVLFVFMNIPEIVERIKLKLKK